MGVSFGSSGVPVLLIAVLSIPIFLFTIFPLLSCVTNTMSGIYILSALWNTDTKPNPYLHLGYYGICWLNLPDGNSVFTQCIGTTGKSAETIAKKVLNNDDSDTLAFIQLYLDLQSKVFVGWLTAGGVIWLVSLILVALVIVAKNNAGSSWRIVSSWLALVAAMLMIASAWSTTSAIRAIEVVYQSKGGVSGGTTLIALQWVAAILTSVYAWAVSRVCNSESSGTVYNYNMGR